MCTTLLNKNFAILNILNVIVVMVTSWRANRRRCENAIFPPYLDTIINSDDFKRLENLWDRRFK